MCLTYAAPPALSLLCHLFLERLGHRLPVPTVHRQCWYVLESPQAHGDTLG